MDALTRSDALAAYSRDIPLPALSPARRLYERLGFRVLGPAVPDGTTAFVPMCVTFPLPSNAEKLAHQWTARIARLKES